MKDLRMRRLLIVTIVFTMALAVTAFADSLPGLSPRWSYLGAIDVDISIENNVASINAECSSYDYSINGMKAKCELQQLNGTWKTIKTWNVSANSATVRFTKKYDVYSGYEYRIKITAYAYADSVLMESATEYFDYGLYEK